MIARKLAITHPTKTRAAQKSPAEVFDMAARLAQALPAVKVRAPIGDRPGEVVVLDGALLAEDGVEVF